MTHPRFFNSLTIFALLFTVGACKSDGSDDDGGMVAAPVPEAELPEATANTLCELFFDCSCESESYPDEPSCVEMRRTAFDEDQLAAQAAGLIYDAQCAGDILQRARASGCAPEPEWTGCTSNCSSYHGQQGVGSACTQPVPNHPEWSDCAQGLACWEGVCLDLCPLEGALGEGEPCRDEMGLSLGTCDGDLFCDFQSNTCIALPKVGEPCYLGEICAPGALCTFGDGENICAAPPGLGEPCDLFCDEGLYCDAEFGEAGTCANLPGAGEPCTPDERCAEDHVCDIEQMTCEPLPAWICYLE